MSSIMVHHVTKQKPSKNQVNKHDDDVQRSSQAPDTNPLQILTAVAEREIRTLQMHRKNLQSATSELGHTPPNLIFWEMTLFFGNKGKKRA